MNFDNDEDGLGLINRLLERLHQAGNKSLGSVNINIYKPFERMMAVTSRFKSILEENGL